MTCFCLIRCLIREVSSVPRWMWFPETEGSSTARGFGLLNPAPGGTGLRPGLTRIPPELVRFSKKTVLSLTFCALLATSHELNLSFHKWKAIGREIGPQDSTPIIPNTTREYNMFVRYPQHDLGVQDAFLASRRFSPPKFKILYQQLYYNCTVRYQHNTVINTSEHTVSTHTNHSHIISTLTNLKIRSTRKTW